MPARLTKCLMDCKDVLDTKDFVEIKKEIYASQVEEHLRHNLWEEYQRALLKGEKMKDTNIYRKICGRDSFYKRAAIKEIMAFLCTPPRDIMEIASSCINAGLSKLEEILVKTELYKTNPKTGAEELDTRQAEMYIKVFNIFKELKYGAPVRRNLNVNINENNENKISNKTAGEIEREINDIKTKYRIIDADATRESSNCQKSE